MKRSLVLSQTHLKTYTTNQNYGSFDIRSPIFNQKPPASIITPNHKPTTHQRHNSLIQYSDLTNIPPKHYNPQPLKKYQSQSKPLYRNDKVANDDYHRVLSEYRTIEEQESAKQPLNHVSKIKKVSSKPPREKEKKNADPLKLAKDELPDQILEQIEKLIREKLQKITPDIIQSLKQEQDQKRNPDKVIKEENNEGSSQNDDLEREITEIQCDPVSQWQVKKEIENKLRKELRKEALGLLKLQKQQQQEYKEQYEREKKKRLEEWEIQKEQEKKKEAKLKKQQKKLEKKEKENKQLEGKQAFQNWMGDYCQKLKEQKIREQNRKEQQYKDLQIRQRLVHLKRKMCDKAYNEWKMKKQEEERMKRMSSYDEQQEFERDDQVDYNANFKEFVDSLVNENQRHQHHEQEHDIYNTPMQQKVGKIEYISGSKKSKKVSTEKKKNGKKKFTKKLILAQEDRRQDAEFERISEKKSSSEQSYEAKKEYQELSSIQKNNASQPVGADSVESIVSGMESQEKQRQ